MAASDAATGNSRLIALAAIGIGVTAAAGSIIGGVGTTASTSEAIPRAVFGAVTGGALVLVAVWTVVRWGSLRWPDARSVATGVIVLMCLGALIGAGSVPGEAATAELELGDRTPSVADVAFQTESGVTASGTVAPLDLDGDGRADVIGIRPILAFDADGDGVEDGRLRPCDRELDVAVPSGSVAVNGRCSSTVERLLPFDSGAVLVARTITPAEPAGRSERRALDLTDGQGTIVLLFGFGLLLIALRFFAQRVDSVPIEAEAHYLDAEAFLDEDDEPDAGAVASALERSLESLRPGGSGDPRDSILAAYATLLDELESVGLGRHRWEAPMEHCRRCLDTAHLPSGPIDELVELFARARFGGHPMTIEDRDTAADVLESSVELLRTRPAMETAR